MRQGAFRKPSVIKDLVRKPRNAKAQSCKQKVTIVFTANASGGKETPIVILKSGNVSHIRKWIKLNFQLTLQPKVWMTGEIMDSILLKVISNFKLQIVYCCLVSR